MKIKQALIRATCEIFLSISCKIHGSKLRLRLSFYIRRTIEASELLPYSVIGCFFFVNLENWIIVELRGFLIPPIKVLFLTNYFIYTFLHFHIYIYKFHLAFRFWTGYLFKKISHFKEKVWVTK